MLALRRRGERRGLRNGAPCGAVIRMGARAVPARSRVGRESVTVLLVEGSDGCRQARGSARGPGGFRRAVPGTVRVMVVVSAGRARPRLLLLGGLGIECDGCVRAPRVDEGGGGRHVVVAAAAAADCVRFVASRWRPSLRPRRRRRARTIVVVVIVVVVLHGIGCACGVHVAGGIRRTDRERCHLPTFNVRKLDATPASCKLAAITLVPQFGLARVALLPAQPEQRGEQLVGRLSLL